MSESENPPVEPDKTVADTPVANAASQHEHEIVDTALGAIDTLLNTSMWALTVLGVVLAIIAILIAVLAIYGWGAIKRTCVTNATTSADERLSEYLNSNEFKKLLEDKIQNSVDKRWQSTVVVRQLTTPAKTQGETNPFPEPEKKE